MKIKLIFIVLLLAGFVASPVYAKKDKAKHLPPGLQKKVARGEPLPPGWQKKLAKGEVLDVAVFQRGKIVAPLDSKGVITIEVEGKLIRLIKATREIVDILK